MNEYSDINELKGVGPKTAPLLHKIGIFTIRDLLNYFPRDYENYNKISLVKDADHFERENIPIILKLRIKTVPLLRYVKSYKILSCMGEDESGIIELSWFNQPYMKNQITVNGEYIIKGHIKRNNASLKMTSPKIIKDLDFEKYSAVLKPVYPLSKGLKASLLTSLMEQALADNISIADYLDDEMRDMISDIYCDIMPVREALGNIHFPKTIEDTVRARRRLVFDEFLCFALSIRQLKSQEMHYKNNCIINKDSRVDAFIKSLPFELTLGQQKCISEIFSDMAGEYSMNRLVQGDVGSGKTIVAFLALINAVFNGYQGVLMAPTEVLARQHFETLNKMLANAGLSNINYGLLTGSVTAKNKRLVKAGLVEGSISIVIGTHALIEDDVVLKRPGIVITDEQHRFGVKQRTKLYENNDIMPHTLVMSATPIPRTLAVILYGDLDISIINEKPANRLPIKNCVVGQNYRPSAYKFITKQVREGRQALIVCPMVEESLQLEAENVIDYTAKIKNELPSDFVIEYLHGKMKNSEKNDIMERFAQGEINVLVSTTVIEVGIDVPNTTVMMVENAERFGLAQLHQLRGRVGRGEYQSYCIFMSASGSKSAMQKLEVLGKTNDGFKVADEDLRLRGPGDMFGFRQSGDMAFRIGDIYTDAEILKIAAKAADMIMADGFNDENGKYRMLYRLVKNYNHDYALKINI